MNTNIIDKEKLKIGDEQTVQAFYDLITPKVRKVVSTILYDRPEFEIEDVTANVLERVFSHLDVIAQSDQPISYCVTVAKNIALESLRDLERQAASLDKYQSELEKASAIADTQSHSNVDNAILISELLDRLPDYERRIFEFVTLGYGFDEIAIALGISGATLRNRYHRALSRLLYEVKERQKNL
jgi:RNA polymerase sigma factor (sigma-70 family)